MASSSGSEDVARSSGESSDRWRYVVLVTKFSLDFLIQGLLTAFGLLVPSLVHKLEANYGTIGFILSIEFTIFYMASPLVCILAKRINPRTLCIVGSVGSSAAIITSAYVDSTIWFGVAMFLTGLLTSPMNQISHEILHQYFGERFGYANSICLMGSWIGGMVFPVLTYKLLEAYGLEGALLCLAAIYLHCAPIAVTFRSPNPTTSGFHHVSNCEEGDMGKTIGVSKCTSAEEKDCTFQVGHGAGEADIARARPSSAACQKEKDSEKSSKYDSILNFFWTTLNIRVLVQEKAFSLLFLPCKFILEVTQVSWILFVVSYAETKGLDESLAAYLPLAGSLGGFINSGLVTVILKYRPHWGAVIFIVDMASVAVTFFLYPPSASFHHLFICSFFAGGGIFGAFPATYSVLVFYVATENFASMLSVKFFVTGVGIVAAGYMSGSLYDVTGSFDDVFMMLGGLSVASVLLTIALMIVKKRPNGPDLDNTTR